MAVNIPSVYRIAWCEVPYSAEKPRERTVKCWPTVIQGTASDRMFFQ